VHPVIGERINMKEFMDAEHIAVSAPALVESIINRALGKRSAKRKIALHTPHYAVVPTILAETDLIAVVPVHVAIVFGNLEKFKTLPLPFKAPAVKVTQFWHQRSHHDRGHIWLRSVLTKLFMHKEKK
jgi:DNA-binding transcriptional LysR family regulator